MKKKIIGTNLVSLIELNGGSITTRLRWHSMPKHARPVGTIVYQEGTSLAHVETGVSVLATSATPFKSAIRRIDAALAVHEIIGAAPSALFEGIMEGWRLAELEIDNDKATAAVTRALHVDDTRAAQLIDSILINVPYDDDVEVPFHNFERVVEGAKQDYVTYCKTHDVTEIIGDPYDDDWTCLCGNDTSAEGFYPVYKGRWIEPLINGPWDSLSVGCASCGRIIDQSTTKVTGRMTDEALLEEQP
jgi:hypothetical protein